MKVPMQFAMARVVAGAFTAKVKSDSTEQKEQKLP